jgi:hypothetical protein
MSRFLQSIDKRIQRSLNGLKDKHDILFRISCIHAFKSVHISRTFGNVNIGKGISILEKKIIPDKSARPAVPVEKWMNREEFIFFERGKNENIIFWNS